MIYNIYCYYKILRLWIAIVSLLYYFTIYYPLSITRTNQYKYYYYDQEYYTTITYWNYYITIIKKLFLLLLLFNYYYYY